MGRGEMEEKELKAELAKEICFMSTAFASCEHLCSNAGKKVFIDWYLILKVDEDSGFDVIRRQYRQLALQLHPDKNKHPKAEGAFKLISEAYSCLSDKARRKSFNGKRNINFCKDCYLKWKSDHHENTNINKIICSQNYSNEDNNNKKLKQQSFIDRAKRNQILQKLKKLQNIFREECRVIESCLTTNRNTTGRESPIFDPYDSIKFPNYPYQRRTTEATAMSSGYCFSQYDKAWEQVPSPVYQMRSDC